jgi:hypothetical protein
LPDITRLGMQENYALKHAAVLLPGRGMGGDRS